MNPSSSFTQRFLSAPQYVCALHQPGDYAAVLVRNRIRPQTTQRILPAETIASAPFQSWLREQNQSGADIFIGMNPVREGSRSRTKEQVREIRHTYLDLDEEAGLPFRRSALPATYRFQILFSIPRPENIKSYGASKVSTRAKRRHCCER
jgi:hypothetical protein